MIRSLADPNHFSLHDKTNRVEEVVANGTSVWILADKDRS